MKEIIFLNGKFVKAKDANVPMLSHGFFYGYGLFETMRCWNRKIVHFPGHIDRIEKSARLLEIKFPYDRNKIKRIIKQALERSGFSDNYIRLTVWKDDVEQVSISVIIKEYKPYPVLKYKKGFSVCVSAVRRDNNSFLSGIKSTSRAVLELAYSKARENNFDEAVFLNNLGYIAEASRSNIFFIRDNTLCTPSLECGCLEGITRGSILDLAKKYGVCVNEGKFTLNDLYGAQQAFLSNSLMGIMPLAYVNDKSIGAIGKLTRFFMDKYNALFKRGF